MRTSLETETGPVGSMAEMGLETEDDTTCDDDGDDDDEPLL